MKKVLILVLLLSAARAAAAQTVAADRLLLNTGPCTESSGSGSPEGVVTGVVCDTYIRTNGSTSVPIVYIKSSGTGNTGWVAIPSPPGSVTSVALSAPGKFTVSGSPVTTTGTLSFAWNWTAHTALVGNATGTPVEIAGCTNGVLRWSASSSDPTCDTNPTVTSATTTGGITLGADELPNQGYTSNLGMLTKKFLTVHAAELWVETLVAQSTVATIGGRIIVAPTNQLVQDLAAATTTVHVKYNNFTNGDRVYMEANGQVEFLAITSAASGSAGNYTYTVTRNLDGTGANDWTAGDAIVDTGQTGNGFLDLYSVRGVKASSEIGPTIVGNVRNSSTFSDWSPRFAIGNLNGLYGYSADTYGAAFGDNAASWIKIDPTNGVRLGNAGSTFAQITAAGSASFTGSITVTGGNAAKTDLTNVTGHYAGSASVGGSANDTALVNGVAASTVQGGAARANLGLNSSGVLTTKAVPGSAASPSGAGLYLGSDFMGYYNGSAWKTYMDNSGQFFLSGSGADNITWNGSTLSVVSTNVTMDSSGMRIAPATTFSTAFPQTRAYAFSPSSSRKMGLYGYEVSGINYQKLYTQYNSGGAGGTVIVQADDGAGGTNGVLASGQYSVGTGVTESGYAASTLITSQIVTASSSASSLVRVLATHGPGGSGIGVIELNGDQIRILTGNMLMDSGAFVYPGTASGLSSLQTSYYLASHVSWGLYTNTSLGLEGSVYAGVSGGAGSGQVFGWGGDSNTYMSNDASDRIRFQAGGIGLFWDSTQVFPETDGTKNLGHPSFRWGTVYASNGTINTSDWRLKTAVTDTRFGLPFVLALHPVDYRWRDPKMGAGVYQGFIAQDVARIDPAFGAISRDEFGTASGLNYGAFVPVLVKALQELDARIRVLEAAAKGKR